MPDKRKGRLVLLAGGMLLLFGASGCLTIRGPHATGTPTPTSTPTPDTTAPSAPGAMSFVIPAGGGTSAYPNATIQGTTGADAGSTAAGTLVTIKFYLNDSTCGAGNLVGVTAAVPGAGFTAITSSLAAGGDGTKAFHYTVEDDSGNVSACAASGLSYVYQAVPQLSFTRIGYSIRENGTAVGSALSVQRDVCGVASSATVTTSDVTAVSGTNYTAGSTVVSFAAADCAPKSVAASAFSIVDDSVKTGDLYFKATLGSITGGVAASDQQIAQVSILDSAIGGAFQFSQPLYTVPAGATSVTLYVQRPVTTATGYVEVAFDNGSALAGTDYDSTTQPLNFAIGEGEKAVTVPITPGTANRSFVAKLVNTGNAAGTRNLSVAKVRILNATETCNPAGAPFGGGNGSVGTPYLICTLTQLKQVPTSLASVFRIEKDIVADGTLSTLGVLTGSLDGNEHILYNFSYVATGTRGGLIQDATGSGFVRGMNLLHVKLSSNTNYVAGLIGLLGNTATQPVVSDNLVSGYVIGSGNGTALVIGGILTAASGAQSISVSNNLSFGLVRVTASGQSGGTLGYLYANPGAASYTANISNQYNAANVLSAQNNIGGVIGRNMLAGTVNVSNLDNRGYVSGGVSVSGVIGDMTPTIAAGSSITLSSLRNHGPVAGSTEVGGVIGISQSWAAVTASTLYNEGPITATTTRAGGLIGDVVMDTSGQAFSLSSATNGGAITGQHVTGGVVGRITASGAVGPVTASVTTAINAGSINGTHSVGGVVGFVWADNTGGGFNVSVTSSSNSGSITSSDTTGRSGGVIGEVSTRIEADPQLTLSQLANTATVICPQGPSCGGVLGRMLLYSTRASTISNSTSSGVISGGNGENFGGLAGYLGFLSGNGSLTVTGSSGTGRVQTNTTTVGRLGGLIGWLQNTTGTVLVTRSSSSAMVDTNVGAAAGLVGELTVDGAAPSTIVERSSTSGDISGASFVGGLVGRIMMTATANTATIRDSYAQGNVTGSSYVGGLVGNANDSSGPGLCTVNLLRNYTRSVQSNTGGASGGLYGSPVNCTMSVTESYWLRDTFINSTYASDANARINGDMIFLTGQVQPTYVGWDFTASGPWNAFVPGSFPTLR